MKKIARLLWICLIFFPSITFSDTFIRDGAGNLRFANVDANGNLTVSFANSTNATPTNNSVYTSIAVANTDQTMLAANATRRGIIFSVSPNSPDSITCNFWGGIVYDSTNNDFSGTALQPGQTIILDVMVTNTLIKCASATAGARISIAEF